MRLANQGNGPCGAGHSASEPKRSWVVFLASVLPGPPNVTLKPTELVRIRGEAAQIVCSATNKNPEFHLFLKRGDTEVSSQGKEMTWRGLSSSQHGGILTSNWLSGLDTRLWPRGRRRGA